MLDPVATTVYVDTPVVVAENMSGVTTLFKPALSVTVQVTPAL